MTEDAFLDALDADPLDDLTRSVYADWLDDRGDPRADYLRAELSGDEAAMRLQPAIDADWAFRAGRRWDVVLHDYGPRRKISIIRVVRKFRSIGLAPGKSLVEQHRPVILPAVPLRLALEAIDHLQGITEQPVPDSVIPQAGGLTVSAGLRPATVESARPVVRGVPYDPTFEAQTFVRLFGVYPDRVMSAARLITEFSNGKRLFEALDACLGPLPVTIAQASGPDEAEELAARFAGLAVVQPYHAPHGTPPAEWMDVCLRPVFEEQLEVMQPWLVRLHGHGYPRNGDRPFIDPYLRRLPRFHAEELLARLSPLGPFYLRRSEDQP